MKISFPASGHQLPFPHPASGPPLGSWERGPVLLSSAWPTWYAPSDPAFLEGTPKFASTDTNSLSRRTQWPPLKRAEHKARCGLHPGLSGCGVTLPRPARVCRGPPPRSFRAFGRARSSSGYSCPPSPRCTLIAPWAGGRGEPGPCIIRGLNGPAACEGRGAGRGAADPAAVWPRGAGALLSSLSALAGV